MDITVEYIFPTPIWRTNILEDIKNINIDMEDVIKECHRIQSNDKGRRISNIGKNAYQSNDLNFQENLDSPLLSIGKIISEIVNVTYNSTWKGALTIHNSWLNINTEEAVNMSHNHPKCILTGCFYVKVSETSGKLCMLRGGNERFIYAGYGDPKTDENGNDIYEPHINEKMSYMPKVGDIFLFPAHVLHLVEPNQTDEERISIAFNCA